MDFKVKMEFGDWDFRDIFMSYIFYTRPDLKKYHDEIVDGLWEWAFAHDTKAEYLIRMIESIAILSYEEYAELDEEERLNCLWNDGNFYAVFE